MIQDQERPVPVKRKPRKPTTFAMDYEQTMIPGHIYQSWLQNASDIVSRTGRKRKVCLRSLICILQFVPFYMVQI